MRTLARVAREIVTLSLIAASACLGSNALDAAVRPDASATAFGDASTSTTDTACASAGAAAR